MCRYDFRVKVDLSHFYHDVRRSSWVYVDKGEISCICHLQKHIEKLFAVQGAFHLLLETGEYLPPNEDARILKENETILVVPGTGLQNQSVLKKVSKDERVVLDASRVSSHLQPKEHVSPEVGKNKSSEDDDGTCSAMETTGENTVFLSMINHDLTMENASTSKPETSVLEDSSILESPSSKPKRKRVRRRKVKSEEQSDQLPGNGAVESEHKKPKMINCVTVPNGKHIRFGDIEKHEFRGYESSATTDSRKVYPNSGEKRSKEGSCWDKPSTDFHLSNLMALRQSSTPITFSRKKQESREAELNVEMPEAKGISIKECQSVERNHQSLSEDMKKYPLMTNKPRLNDVVTFKILKMGNDYTPQVSGNISARVNQALADGSSYSFQILHGKDEVQEPQGKFDIETEETEDNEKDAVTLSWLQLIEPRLIFRE